MEDKKAKFLVYIVIAFIAFIATISLSAYINILHDLEMIEITAFLLVGFLIYTHIIT
jgi:hypothetical protein